MTYYPITAEKGKFRILLKKSAEIGQISCEIRDFPGEKGRFGSLLLSELFDRVQ